MSIKKVKKIENVVIINDFDYTQGGASKVAIYTANELAKKFSDLKVYFFSAVHDDSSTLNDKVIKICCNQKEFLKYKNKIKGIFNGIYNFHAKKELKKLLKTLDKEKTIIHYHGWTKALSSSVFHISFKMKFKTVLTLHDYFAVCPNGGYFNYVKNEKCPFRALSFNCIKCNCDSRNYLFKLYRVIRFYVQNKIIKLNDNITNLISISEFSEKILKKSFNDNTKIYRIYNPIETTGVTKNVNFIDNSKKDYYLYVGRISKEKGVDIFCEAITKLNLKGIVVGDGDQKEELEKEYPSIEFVGWKNIFEIEKYMLNAKALIFPSKCYETMGMTVMEAFSYGLPCIASKDCAASDFINDNVNGLTYDKDLENAIKKYQLLDTKLLMNNAMKTFKEYEENSYIDELILVYGRLNNAE